MMNPAFEKFLDMVAERHGNPNAVFATQRLLPKQKVRVIHHETQQIIEAVATGKRDRRGHQILTLTDGNGRKWKLVVKRRDILVQW
jgi:hypothetical protein